MIGVLITFHRVFFVYLILSKFQVQRQSSSVGLEVAMEEARGEMGSQSIKPVLPDSGLSSGLYGCHYKDDVNQPTMFSYMKPALNDPVTTLHVRSFLFQDFPFLNSPEHCCNFRHCRGTIMSALIPAPGHCQSMECCCYRGS